MFGAHLKDGEKYYWRKRFKVSRAQERAQRCGLLASACVFLRARGVRAGDCLSRQLYVPCVHLHGPSQAASAAARQVLRAQ